MNKKIFKIGIMVLSLLIIVIGTMYLIDAARMKKGEEVIFGTWGSKNSPILKVESNENNVFNEDYKKYSKTVDNIKFELSIPNTWKYKEVSKNEDGDFYIYALKLYKSTEEEYAMLYFYDSPFVVCGTGRTTENVILNNGKEAAIGYYHWEKENWSDISFYSMHKNVALINYNLTGHEADEVIEFIKSINIIEKDL